MKQNLPIITPNDVGGMPECFMCYRKCPVCGQLNDETFMMHGADYRCDGCCNTLLYRVPASIRRRSKPKDHGPHKMKYTYLITWNGL